MINDCFEKADNLDAHSSFKNIRSVLKSHSVYTHIAHTRIFLHFEITAINCASTKW